MKKNGLPFKKPNSQRGLLTSVLMAAASVFGLVGCQSDVKQTEAVLNSQSGIAITLENDDTSEIKKVNDASNIIVDKEAGNLYYFFKDGETVNLSSVGDIDGITSVNISPLEDNYNFDKIIGFDESQNTNNVTTLSVSGGVLNDFSFLDSFGSVTDLSFSSCNINAVSSEYSLTDVKRLSLKNCCVNETSVINKMYNLAGVTVEDCEIDNIDFLSNMHDLTYIYFANTPIKNIPYLTLRDTDDGINDHRHIYFQNCGEIDISGLSGLKNSKWIIFKIVLGDNVIHDFSPLAELPYIYELDLSGTAGSDFSTLKGVSSHTIWLDDCNLSDIGFLSHNKVGTLSLSNNNIYDWSTLLDVDGLRWCWTFDNPVIMPDNKEEFEEKEIFLADSNKWAYPY